MCIDHAAIRTNGRTLNTQLAFGRRRVAGTFVARAEMRVGVAVTRPSSFYIIDLLP